MCQMREGTVLGSTGVALAPGGPQAGPEGAWQGRRRPGYGWSCSLGATQPFLCPPCPERLFPGAGTPHRGGALPGVRPEEAFRQIRCLPSHQRVRGLLGCFLGGDPTRTWASFGWRHLLTPCIVCQRGDSSCRFGGPPK